MSVRCYRMSRELAVQRKLQFDDGNMEDRRYAMIVSSVPTMMKDEPSAKAEAFKALKHLDQLEVFMRKQNLIAQMCKRQTNEYEEMATSVDEQVAETKNLMTKAKEELAAARIERQNRQKYDLLARMIQEHPSRADTTRKLEELRDELTQQQERQQQLEAKLSERRNHLHAFNIILSNFQQFITDEDEDDGEESKDDDKEDQERNSKEGSVAMEE